MSEASGLDGSLGKVVGAPDPDTGRLPVRLFSPPAALLRYPNGVKINPPNLEPLPARRQKAVRLSPGFTADAVELSPEQSAGCAWQAGWLKCPVPTLLGLPLALHRLEPRGARPTAGEQVSFYLMIDPVTGLVPPSSPATSPSGYMGPVLVARTDGEDFTLEQMWALHDYNCRLLDYYSDWCERPPAESDAERLAMLTPAAYADFLVQEEENRALNKKFQEEEEEQADAAAAATAVPAAATGASAAVVAATEQ